MRHACGTVSDNNGVGSHCIEIHCRIDQCLSLCEARRRDTYIYRVSGKAFCCKLEGSSGPGGIFEKEVDNGLAAESRDFFDFAGVDLAKILGGIENACNLRG